MECTPKAHRPELLLAPDLARLTGATLVIAKLDPPSRNTALLLTLRDSGPRYLACETAEANDLTVGIMALVAQAEREAMTRRTKEALAAAKARGVKLGNPNGAAALTRSDDTGRALRRTVSANADRFAAALKAAIRANADAFAADLAETWIQSKAEGHTTLRAIATALESRGMQTWAVAGVDCEGADRAVGQDWHNYSRRSILLISPISSWCQSPAVPSGQRTRASAEVAVPSPK